MMISERIRLLRESAGYSQSQLAKKLDVTRSSVNAWEMGLSTPTIQYVFAPSKLFHISTDYLLGVEATLSIQLDTYSTEEREVLFSLIRYFDSQRK